jgi:Transposase DDE domain
VDGCITKAPGGGQCVGPSPVDRRKQGMKRSLMVEGYAIPLARVLAGANRHDSPLLAAILDHLDDVGPLPVNITVHLDSGYDSGKTREELAGRGLRGQIASKGQNAPIQASNRWHVERTNAWHNAFNRLQRCYEHREPVIAALFDSPTRSSPCVARSGKRGSATDGTPDPHADHKPHLSARTLSLSFKVSGSGWTPGW